jgi:hypothetical protein
MQPNGNPIKDGGETIKQIYNSLLNNQILQVVLLKISSKLMFEIYPAPFQAIAEAASLECSTNNIEHPTNPKFSFKHS